MARQHLLRGGTWLPCDRGACDLPFHLDMPPEGPDALPMAMLLPLLNSLQPPDIAAVDGLLMWLDINALRPHRMQLHRDYDLPAVVYPNGDMEWWLHGRQHRGGDLPAVIRGPVERAWYVDGKPHRMDGPAVIHPDGRGEWWWHGEAVTGPPRP